MRDDVTLTPELLLQAYRVGVFPMSESRDDDEVFWVDPRWRGILPLDHFHISRSLARTMRRGHLTATADTSYGEVVQGCADRPETWINTTIYDLYCALHAQGYGHSIEIWQDHDLVGGVYGIAIGGAFFGESMFSKVTDASKMALAYLVDRLSTQGYALFDAQFLTPHLSALGAIEISRADYHVLLADALEMERDFGPAGPLPPPQDVIQRNAQMS